MPVPAGAAPRVATLVPYGQGRVRGLGPEELGVHGDQMDRLVALGLPTVTGVTVPVEQQTANEELYRQLFGAGANATLGDAVRQAKQVTQDPDIRRTWILFGDPAMRLR